MTITRTEHEVVARRACYVAYCPTRDPCPLGARGQFGGATRDRHARPGPGTDRVVAAGFHRHEVSTRPTRVHVNAGMGNACPARSMRSLPTMNGCTRDPRNACHQRQGRCRRADGQRDGHRQRVMHTRPPQAQAPRAIDVANREARGNVTDWCVLSSETAGQSDNEARPNARHASDKRIPRRAARKHLRRHSLRKSAPIGQHPQCRDADEYHADDQQRGHAFERRAMSLAKAPFCRSACARHVHCPRQRVLWCDDTADFRKRQWHPQPRAFSLDGSRPAARRRQRGPTCAGHRQRA